MGNAAGPVELWHAKERASATQAESELLTASASASAAAAATVQQLWGTVFDTTIEVLLGGNAQFTKLHELPTLEVPTTEPARGGHEEF